MNCRFYGLGPIGFLAGIVTALWRRHLARKAVAQIQSLPVNEGNWSLLVISTDIQRLFEEYLRPPGRRFGIIKPLILDESPACLKEPRCVLVLRSWFKSAVNLAIEEQVSQAVEFRNTSCCKTKHSSWTYGWFAKLQRVSVLEIRSAF